MLANWLRKLGIIKYFHNNFVWTGSEFMWIFGHEESMDNGSFGLNFV